MKHILLGAALSALLFASATAQTTYSRVRIGGTPQQLSQLRGSGVIDHFHPEKNGLVTELADTDIEALKNQGYSVETLQTDLSAFYANRLAHPAATDKAGGDCTEGLAYVDPTHFNLGSMGGYLTYTEILAELDAMATQYPNIFKAKAPISTFLTHENRPLHWVKISDNPNTDEAEPRVFYNALIHAREAITPMQLVYFMWYVLENYGTDAEITYLVDNCEMYFIPVVNPDGYVENQTTDPNGGGMHRKNKRPTGGNNPGVDLNRNFGYQWGVSGASTNVTNDTYMGPAAFSEPETQAMKWFEDQYDFTAALTHHSYANLLLWPYGYDDVQTPDNTLYAQMTAEMVTENHFTNEQSVTLYPAAGDTDDWMYTATPDKPKVLAMTPESGGDDDGFWPATERILPMCRANLKMNLDLARFVVKYGVTRANGAHWVSGTAQQLTFDFKRFGQVNGTFTVSLQSLSAQASVTGAPVVFNNPAHLAPLTGNIAYTVDAGTTNGTELKFVLITDNGSYQLRDTVERTYTTATPIFQEMGNNVGQWTFTGGSWATTASTFVSAPTSITDSPSGDYDTDVQTSIILANPIDLSDASMALLQFWTRWDVEAGYDYVQLEANTGGNSWTPLCGHYTKTGIATQGSAANEPLYDGTQTNWVLEEVSLADYVGSANLKLRFRLYSDGGVTGDGFYFDDFVVKAMLAPNAWVKENLVSDIQVYPNPSTGTFTLKNITEKTQITVTNSTGQAVYQKTLTQAGNAEIILDEFPAGIYFLTQQTGNRVNTKKIVIQR